MRKRKQKSNEQDPRVNTKHITMKDFLIIYLVITILTFGQAMILLAFLNIHIMVPVDYLWGMMSYWAIVSLIFCLVSARQRYRTYDKPMIILSRAAKKVAEGDYSITVPPVRKDGKKDYVEVMIDDFNKMVEELRSTEILKNDFIANVSHEIKTPLSVIQSYAMALQKQDLNDQKKKEYTDTIITASKKLTMLVTNILKLNKLENQEILPTAEPYDLCRQLSECALAFEELWEQKNITFSADIEERAIINADEEMMAIVWNNLLSNAIKFTEPGGTIKLTQFSNDNTVIVTVEDSGCGMSEDATKHIFDKFYQEDTSHSQEGNGLGLALALKVIQLVDGRISVSSKLGSGTTFKVELKKNNK